jgi:hypothetical protein
MIRLPEVGAMLRGAGLTPRELAAWASPRLSALPHLLPSVPRGDTPAGALLELFVAGRDVVLDLLGHLDLDALHHHGLIEVAAGAAHATVAILPLAESLLVCDRLDAPHHRELVCWPDDSRYHLAHALPGKRCSAWIDLCCGSAFAPLLRPELAVSIVGTDDNPRAIRYAQLGRDLSGLRHLYTLAGDLGDTLELSSRHADLVTCDAPIAGDADELYRTLWRSSDAELVARVFETAHRMVLPFGMVVVHAAADALDQVLADLPGDRVAMTYMPPGSRAFGVAWWRPDGSTRHITAQRDLTPQHPHLTYADYKAAIAS